MLKRIDHVEIMPHDFERAIGFYAGALGSELRKGAGLTPPPWKKTLEDGRVFLQQRIIDGTARSRNAATKVSYSRQPGGSFDVKIIDGVFQQAAAARDFEPAGQECGDDVLASAVFNINHRANE